MKKNSKIVFRKIHGAFFLIDISDNYVGDRCSIYELNETGAFLWNHISECSTVDTLTTELKNAIVDDVDYTLIYEDVLGFINMLLSNGFIVRK